MDSPGPDVGDGALDDLADPVDALVLLLRLLVEFSVGGLLMRGDHPPSHVSLVADPPGGVHTPPAARQAPGAATSCMDPG